MGDAPKPASLKPWSLAWLATALLAAWLLWTLVLAGRFFAGPLPKSNMSFLFRFLLLLFILDIVLAAGAGLRNHLAWRGLQFEDDEAFLRAPCPDQEPERSAWVWEWRFRYLTWAGSALMIAVMLLRG